MPFLPRGAKIEWHVVCAHPTSTEYAIEKLELSDEVDETSVVIESTSRRKGEYNGWEGGG